MVRSGGRDSRFLVTSLLGMTWLLLDGGALAVWAISHNAFAVFYRDGLSGFHVRQLVHLAAGPWNFDGVGFRLLTQAKGENQFALRKIAGAGAQHFLLLVTS